MTQCGCYIVSQIGKFLCCFLMHLVWYFSAFISSYSTCTLIVKKETECGERKGLNKKWFFHSSHGNIPYTRKFLRRKFSRISQILLSHEIKFYKSISMPHLLYCTRESFAKIFFAKLSFATISDAKISQYTVSACTKANLGLHIPP